MVKGRNLKFFIFTSIILCLCVPVVNAKAKGPKELLEMAKERDINLPPEAREFLERGAQGQIESEVKSEKWHREFPEKWKQLHGKWKTVLVERIQDANRIEIRSIPWQNNESKVLFAINGNNKVREFMDIVEVTENRGSCSCYGSALIVFCKDSNEIAVLSWHHGFSLRWDDGPWLGDALLSEKAIIELPKWFIIQGYSGFSEEVENGLRHYKIMQMGKIVRRIVNMVFIVALFLLALLIYYICKKLVQSYKSKTVQADIPM
ncbi:MAG: hypothetical protein ABFD79_08570 [Phycisphaerales bacterium]